MPTIKITTESATKEWVLVAEKNSNVILQTTNQPINFATATEFPTNLNAKDSLRIDPFERLNYIGNSYDNIYVLIDNKDQVIADISNIPIEKSYYLAVSSNQINGARAAQIEGNLVKTTVTDTGYDISELGIAQIPTPDIENGELMSFVSTSSDDTALGTGATEVTIEYIDSNDKLLKSVSYATNGTTPVDINESISFVSDFYVSKNGTTEGVANGDITIYRRTDNTRVYDIVKANGNKSLTSSRLIPDDKDFLLTSYVVSGDSKGCSVRLRATITDSGNITDSWVFRMPLTITQGGAVTEFNPPIRIPANSRVKCTVFAPESEIINNVYVSVFLNGIIENKRS